MKRTTSCVAVLILVSALATGCTKKQPATPASTDLEVATTTVAPTPAPAPAAAAADPWSGDLQEVNRYAREQGLLGDVYFDYDRTELKPEARDRLAANSRFLVEHPQFRVRVEGHADERGTNDYNLALGQNRASIARGYVSTLGVGSDRIEVVSYGKERPVCSAPDEDCWWRNRRASFVIVGRQAG